MIFTYVSFDPGKTTGVVGWDRQGEVLYADQLNQEQLDEFLITLSAQEYLPEIFIIEDYIVRPNVPHGGSRVETIQVIGQLKSFARINRMLFFMQPATILSIAQKWSGVSMPKKHSESHWVSAYLHGYYWLHKKGVIKPRVLEDE